MDALYYPRIEVSDSSWLLSAALLWDRIRTITPDIPIPYSEPVSLELLGEGILVPERVSPQSPPALSIVERIEDLLASPYAKTVVGDDSWLVRQTYIHRSKIESNLQHAIDRMFGRSSAHSDFCRLPEDIGAAYMLALATALAEQGGFRIVTDEPHIFKAAEAVLWPTASQQDRWLDRERLDEMASSVVDVVLTHMAHHWLRISDDTPVAKIISFRHNRHDELQRLRDVLQDRAAQLVRLSADGAEFESIQEKARSLLADELLPSLSTVETCLRESRIDFALETVEAAVASELPGGLAAAITTPWALVAAPALTIVARSARFFLRRRRAVQECPYSYLIRARRELG
ncbi:MAG TPA: DUF6236 family protein [Candidatus Hydrogenedentes bacterium]|nr:DUF6236 family protein [Candidatus Hydrogenedentota bacterium]HPG68339.1 DUF6236 family protein [Candidatus Hydrogenedentota bacterium]